MAQGDPNLTKIANIASDAHSELLTTHTSLAELAEVLEQVGLKHRAQFTRQLMGRIQALAKDQQAIVDLCNNITQPITLDLE